MKPNKDSKFIIIIICALVLGMFLIIFGGNGIFKKTDKSEETTCESFERDLEQRLSSLISSLYGIDSQVRIMIYSEKESSNTSLPKIKGVAVVCRAGDGAKAEITSLLSAILGIPSTRIFVGSMT